MNPMKEKSMMFLGLAGMCCTRYIISL